jgi:hypothetical protein
MVPVRLLLRHGVTTFAARHIIHRNSCAHSMLYTCSCCADAAGTVPMCSMRYVTHHTSHGCATRPYAHSPYPLPAAGELTREDRKRRRAHKKAVSKNREAAKTADKKAKAAAEGGEAGIAGRRSESGAASAKAAKYTGKTEFSRSRGVFAKIQEQRDADAAGIKLGKKPAQDENKVSGARLKL